MRYGTRWKVAAGAAALAMLVTACGDDDEDEATSDTTAAAEGPDSEYCRLAAEFDESEGVPTIEDFERIGAAAPDAIREEIDAVIPVFQQYAEDDDLFGAFEDPVVEENIPAIEAYEADVCGLGDDEGDDEAAADFVVAPEDEEYCAISQEVNDQEDFPSVEQLETLRDAAPEEIADEANIVVDAFLANQDDPFAAFEDPAVQEAFGPIEAFDEEHCGIVSDDGEDEEQDPSVTEPDESAAQVAVTAVDYEFQFDAPAAGRTQFTMTNDGDERHVMDVFRIEDGATMDSIIEAEGEEGIVEGSEFESDSAAPGETAILTLDLEPGNYGMICYIPNSDGTPHLALGMVKEFTVQ